MAKNPITSTVDFQKDGVQHGFLNLPYSCDQSAWGSIRIPVTVAKNGEGPTVLFTGANHGDEYEGPIALFDLARNIKAAELYGRVIIVPGMNYPAFRNGTRTSPIDGGNLNRMFPGDPSGSVTSKIADYFYRTLLPLADFVVDFHSGGKTLEFIPFCCAHVLDNKEQEEKCVAAMRAFNAPYSVMLMEIDPENMYDTAAERMGKVVIGTELSGGGTSTVYTNEIAKRGIRNILKHAGIVKGDLEQASSTELNVPDPSCFLFCENSGLLEPCVDLGDVVVAGQIVARVHPIGRTGAQPEEYHAAIGGVFSGRHFPGLISAGDFLGLVTVPL
ncbi:N(2)-acetyl-L-2,4-diaminobutanoate deacetylase DoeB [Mesorhizobium delmotii]|uniref:Putative succinylglutamate desuccinylase/aspartoacylase family protein n=1 Tax=Mesorhizobium delmotii TaxID=1631247 RepID=A0A2P9AG77_9HYPH|nr:N(2)-acetyl-L-2,4-diaminobutanoate deacetylase DoeB [Mesorhizobium delmotii]SJM30129.1 putative succinylglutamate desuccinylase/aspartoacylase family protein [Mesorhizobium delmotii]